MFLPGEKSVMNFVVENTFDEFVDMNQAENLNTTSAEDFKDGNVLFKTPVNKGYMTGLCDEFRNPSHDPANFIGPQKYLKKLQTML